LTTTRLVCRKYVVTLKRARFYLVDVIAVARSIGELKVSSINKEDQDFLGLAMIRGFPLIIRSVVAQATDKIAAGAITRTADINKATVVRAISKYRPHTRISC